ncbi:MAG: hypothetical protein PHE67_03100 [Campylobacterales bacterium]|nr:hypothetical protein [Campylobacterales bacterium]
MKFTKLSLAALVAMGIASSASAVENVKVDGSIKLWYQTTDTKASTGAVTAADGVATSETDGLFKKDGATGDLVAKLRATGDLTKKVGFGFTMYAATTLGLENNLVNNEAINNASSSAGNSGLNGTDKNPVWLGEAYFTYKMGKTIAKIGRQELDTPLAYTETWNAAPNTFEAAVLVNQDIPDTTLVAAYVSRGNGYNSNATAANPKTVNSNGEFSNYHTLISNAGAVGAGQDAGGAYAAGLVNKSIPNLTVHPVYYNVLDTATAFWADVTYDLPKIVKVEAAYATVDPVGSTQKYLDSVTAASNKTTNGYAAQVSGEVVGVKLAASYSKIDKGFLPVGNTATGFKKTKIYTASILSDGLVAGRPDTTGAKLSVGYDIAGIGLSASYAEYKVGNNDGKANWFNAGVGTTSTQGGAAGVEYKPREFDFSVTTKLDEVNLALYYINQKEASKTAAGVTTDVQAVRAIATINF